MDGAVHLGPTGRGRLGDLEGGLRSPRILDGCGGVLGAGLAGEVGLLHGVCRFGAGGCGVLKGSARRCPSTWSWFIICFLLFPVSFLLLLLILMFCRSTALLLFTFSFSLLTSFRSDSCISLGLENGSAKKRTVKVLIRMVQHKVDRFNIFQVFRDLYDGFALANRSFESLKSTVFDLFGSAGLRQCFLAIIEVNVEHTITIGIERKLCLDPFCLDGRATDIVSDPVHRFPLLVEVLQDELEDVHNA